MGCFYSLWIQLVLGTFIIDPINSQELTSIFNGYDITIDYCSNTILGLVIFWGRYEMIAAWPKSPAIIANLDWFPVMCCKTCGCDMWLFFRN